MRLLRMRGGMIPEDGRPRRRTLGVRVFFCRYRFSKTYVFSATTGSYRSSLKAERLFLAFLCQCVEVAAAGVQHTCAYQLINGIEHLQPLFRLVAPGFEEHMQVQAVLPHCSE